jgi:alpha-tubulin suppressor-like RCC1 family protein
MKRILMLLLICVALRAFSQIGDGTEIDREKPTRSINNVSMVSAGSAYSLAIKQDNTLWGCGNNEYGQLGNGTTNSSQVYVKIMNDAVFVSCGWNHSLVVKKDKSLWAFGENTDGQLGDGTITNRTSPVKITDDVAYACASANHSVILKTNGTVWTFGKNDAGELGDGTFEDRLKPTKVFSNAKQIAVGMYHTCILGKDSKLYVCGWNGFNQLGNAKEKQNKPYLLSNSVQTVFSNPSSYLTLYTDNDNKLWAYGYETTILDIDGKVNNPAMVSDNVIYASAGEEQLVFIKMDGTTWGVGGGSPNDKGLLGLKVKKYSIPIELLKNCKSVSAAVYHTIFLLNDGSVFTSGYNGKSGLM